MLQRIEFHPRLVEDAVWAGVRRRRDAGVFHRERESLYGERDPEERDRAFARFHQSWFERLNLAEPITRALGEEARFLSAARRVLFVPAGAEDREGAELFVAAPGEFSIVVTLRPGSLENGGKALAFFRREFLHVADMLDPAFEYEPRLPRQPAGPAHDRRLQDRYRVLWDCSIDGRLRCLGRIDVAARGVRLGEFRRTFECLGDEVDACFERVFSGPRPRHAQMVAMAADPETVFGLRAPGPARSGRCPLCAFPTIDWEPHPELLPDEVALAIESEFPGWKVDQGLCPQCADLYRAASLRARAPTGA